MSARERFDVVVVGAGPSGSMTAKFAARGGARVLMLEKRQEIGTPVRCGEGISKAWLPECGITLDKRWLAHEVKGARVISPSGYEFKVSEEHAGNEVGAVIERDEFDKALATDAAKAGAEIRLKSPVVGLLRDNGKITGVKVKALDRSYEVEAGCVVAADGFESQVGRWAGLDTIVAARDITSCLQYRLTNIDADPDYCEFYLGSCAPGGYLWIFPKSDDTANVGIGVQLYKLKQKGATKQYLDSWIARQPRFNKGRPLEYVCGGVSVSAPLEKTIMDGLLIVGDAARMIDAITGGGISNGCRAGKVAGQVLAECAQSKDFSEAALQKYERGWRDILEEGLYRDWLAKEKLTTLSDEDFDKIVSALAEVNIDKLSVHAILQAIQRKYPELVKTFEDLL